ncbi:ComF family protein [Qipengyuania sp. ASV99]|uniref:ComF family protein n=1 Tax=Qipengyuania sp. ASV99 TaxID=3399681 RepID=UPI003A4C7326
MGWRSQLGTSVKEGLGPIIDLVYPPRCPLCGAAIAAQGGLCADCWSELEFPGNPACAACQRPMGSAAAVKSDQCYSCNLAPPHHAGIAAATIYNDASRKLILSFKHGGKIALAGLLGRLMAGRLDDPEGEPPLIVPVPLHRLRIWQRGYNQAALLAQELSRHGKGELAVDALVRQKRTPSLGGLGQEARRMALSGAIAVRSGAGAMIAHRRVILVDDVLTSGATTDACVAALLDAGAASVRIACFARVVDGRGMETGNRAR